MVKWKGVMKISSKMRSKMERSNKNTRTKMQWNFHYAQYKGQANGRGVVETRGGVETRGSKLVFYRGRNLRGRNFSPELHRQHHTAGMPLRGSGESGAAEPRRSSRRRQAAPPSQQQDFIFFYKIL
jgi:hypothetical protein